MLAAGTRQIARELLAGVGPAVLRAMTGTSDPQALAAWVTPDGPAMSEDVEDRLRLAHHVWTVLASASGPSVALAWLVGANPRLASATPVTAIRMLRTSDVLGAAHAFVDDVPC